MDTWLKCLEEMLQGVCDSDSTVTVDFKGMDFKIVEKNSTTFIELGPVKATKIVTV